MVITIFLTFKQSKNLKAQVDYLESQAKYFETESKNFRKKMILERAPFILLDDSESDDYFKLCDNTRMLWCDEQDLANANYIISSADIDTNSLPKDNMYEIALPLKNHGNGICKSLFVIRRIRTSENFTSYGCIASLEFLLSNKTVKLSTYNCGITYFKSLKHPNTLDRFPMISSLILSGRFDNDKAIFIDRSLDWAPTEFDSLSTEYVVLYTDINNDVVNSLEITIDIRLNTRFEELIYNNYGYFINGDLNDISFSCIKHIDVDISSMYGEDLAQIYKSYACKTKLYDF